MSRPIEGRITIESRKKRIAIALSDNTLGNAPPEQVKTVKITAKTVIDFIEEGREVIIAHDNDSQVDMVNSAVVTLSCGNAKQPNTPPSVCVAVGQTYIGYDLQNTLREKLYNREIYGIPVIAVIAQVRVDVDDPAFEAPSKPIGHFMAKEQAKTAEKKYGYIVKEDSEHGYRRVVASPKPAEIAEVGAICSLADSDQLVTACGGGGIPVTHQENHLGDTNVIIDKGFANELLAKNLNADSLIVLITVGKVAINFREPEEKWLDDLDTKEARQFIREGYFTPGSMLPRVQTAAEFVESKPGHTALITLLEGAKDGVQRRTDTHIHLA